MYKLGLKLWSTNTDFYFDEAIRLYKEDVFDYVELYIVPGTLDTLSKWETIGIPITLHAPHFAHGFNLAVAEKKQYNIKIYREVKKFAERLNTDFIIFHGGNRGSIESTVHQLFLFNESRAVIENKPFYTLKDKLRCIGATPDEIFFIKKSVGCMFCLDIGHAICSANSQGIEPYSCIKAFMAIYPVMFHISGIENIKSSVDTHLNLFEGQLDPKKIAKILPSGAKVTIETAKNSKRNLNDFYRDILWMRSL